LFNDYKYAGIATKVNLTTNLPRNPFWIDPLERNFDYSLLFYETSDQIEIRPFDHGIQALNFSTGDPDKEEDLDLSLLFKEEENFNLKLRAERLDLFVNCVLRFSTEGKNCTTVNPTKIPCRYKLDPKQSGNFWGANQTGLQVHDRWLDGLNRHLTRLTTQGNDFFFQQFSPYGHLSRPPETTRNELWNGLSSFVADHKDNSVILN